jgi:protein-disulfide isomerase
MQRYFMFSLAIIVCVTSLSAQQKNPPTHPTRPDKPAAKEPPVPQFSTRLPSEDTVNAFLQQMFGYDPTVTWKIVEIRPSQAQGLSEVLVQLSTAQGKQAQRLYVTADGQHAVLGEIIPFGAHPFTAARDALLKGMNGFSMGPSDASVTIFEFSDLQCPYCKQAQPTIDKLLAEEKNARLVFQQFPLPAHNWAQKGAYYADCAGRKSNEAFWKFIHSAFESQADITPENVDEKLTALADQAGVKGKEVAQCAATADTAGRVQHSIALGSSVDVSGTPTLFINGRKIGNVTNLPYDVLKGLVEFAARRKD